ncbi:MAG: beta-galactosidase [Deltaproteobacteria bacterium]
MSLRFRRLLACCVPVVGLFFSLQAAASAGGAAGRPAGPRVGTTFSPVQCAYLGLDWKETFQKTLSLSFDIIRLAAYWDRIERVPDVYDFSELDWQIEQARRAGVEVLLTVGMKAPRWPEFFIPAWVLEKEEIAFGSDVSTHPYVRARALKFIEAVAAHYAGEASIVAWQVENEPLNRAGAGQWRIGRSFLKEEIARVRRADPAARPVVVNAMTYANRYLRFLARLAYRRNPVYEVAEIADIPAYNIYPAIGERVLGAGMCFFSQPGRRLRYLEQIARAAVRRNKPFWVTELQAEPWEPGQLVHAARGMALTCGPANIEEGFREAKRLGADTVFLWGVEYWFFRQQVFGDPSWLEAVRRLRQEERTPAS